MPDRYKKKVGPTQRNKYSEESMRQAVNYVKQRKGSIRAAAERFEVPKSTLSEKVRGPRCS